MRVSATVVIVDNTQHLGGILTSGLMTDTVYPQGTQGIGGFPHQFYLDLGKYYNSNGKPQYQFEPHAAESIFNDYLNSPRCTVLRGRRLSSATIVNGRIQSITLDDATSVAGRQWIDASYEGDLMAKAASYFVGRESRPQYGESYAGWGLQEAYGFSPLLSNGSLIPGVSEDSQERIGQADGKIMAYSFRNCITSNRSNMTPFPEPPGYNPEQFALTSRVIAQNKSTQLEQVIDLQPGVNKKFCLLSTGLGSTDYVGGSWTYPDGTWATRESVWQNHYNYVAGLLYFLSHDASVPSSIRTSLQGYGLPLDEFKDNGHWPWQMYVREGRRLQGRYIMTQEDVTVNRTKSDSIGVGAWALDSHACDLIPNTRNGSGTVVDGLFYQVGTGDAYELPFSSMLPQQSEVSNLAVPVCLSASHVGYSSVRIEPTFMILGEAAGTAAGLALESGIDLSEVVVSALQSKLVKYGVVTSLG
jgi:hypothetical protein